MITLSHVHIVAFPMDSMGEVDTQLSPYEAVMKYVPI